MVMMNDGVVTKIIETKD